MHAILLVLLCTMTFVRADSMEDIIRDTRVRNEEADELSSDSSNVEHFQRFIGDTIFNRRRRRSGELESDFSHNDGTRINAKKNKNSQKRKTHAGRKHRQFGDLFRKKKKRDRLLRKNMAGQIEKPNLNEENEEQEIVHDLTTCIMVTAGTSESSDLSTTTLESTSEELQTTLESTSSICSNESTTLEENKEFTTSFNEEDNTLSTETTSLPLELTTIFDNSKTTDLNSEVTTETADTTSMEEFSTTPGIEVNEGSKKTNERDKDTDSENGLKKFTVELICKISKADSASNLQKVYQCYFGGSDAVSFYMPALQDSILSKKVEDAFPTIQPDKFGYVKPYNVVHEIVSGSTVLPGNNTWRLIEATGVRTRIIEKTDHNKNNTKLEKRRIKKRLKRRSKKRRRNSENINTPIKQIRVT